MQLLRPPAWAHAAESASAALAAAPAELEAQQGSEEPGSADDLSPKSAGERGAAVDFIGVPTLFPFVFWAACASSYLSLGGYLDATRSWRWQCMLAMFRFLGL